jgi:hypothetical protein
MPELGTARDARCSVGTGTWGHRYPFPHLNFGDSEGRCRDVLQQPEGLGPTASEGAEARQFPSASEARPV